MLLVDHILNFVGNWWKAFFLTFILASMLFGGLNLITGYALIILLLFVSIIQELRKLVAQAKVLIELLDLKKKPKEGPWT